MRGHRSAPLAGALTLVLLALACTRDDGDDESALELRSQLEHCAQTIERLAGIDGSRRTAALARGCPYACEGLESYGRQSRGAAADRAIEPLVEGCGFFCSEAASDAWDGAEPGEALAALVGACGHDYYGLREDTESLFSDAFFVVHRVGEWLAGARAALPEGDELAERLDRATAAVHLPLAPPSSAPGFYELAPAAAAEPVNAAFYVVVGEQDLRAAAIRVARLRGKGVELRPVPGGAFPGERLSDDDPEASFRERESALRGLHPDPEVAASPPLLLASGALSVERLFDAAAALEQPRYRLGVAGRSARAHPVGLERIPEFGSAAPTIELGDGEAVVPDTDEPISTRTADTEELEEALRHLVALRAPLDRIEVRPGEASTVEDLVRLADAADRARIRAIAFSRRPKE